MMLADQDKEKNDRTRAAARAGQGAAQRFDVQSRTAEGTIWIVYRARDRASGQALALKALKPAFNRHTLFVQSLYDLARTWLDLSHPNLASLHEVGTEGGVLYLAVDWLSGPTLESRLQGGPLDRRETITALRDVTRALLYLHGRGFCHGDVRPRQVIANETGDWVLTDCGTAAAFGAAGMATADAQPDAAYYLAPERTQGGGISPATDMYSVGVMLFRMLTGAMPFEGPSTLAIALRQRNDIPAHPSTVNPRCDRALEALCLNLLEKDPARRREAGAFLKALEELPAKAVPGVPVPSAAATVPASVASADPDLRVHRRVSPILDPNAPAPAPTPAAAPAPAPPPDLPRLKRKHAVREFWGAVGGLALLLISIAGMAGLFAYDYHIWQRDTPPQIAVPNYVGLDKDAAAQVLAAADLTMTVSKEAFDPQKPAGTVLSGDPPPGKIVRSHREITVTISEGQKPLPMYDFNELSLDQARQIILQHGMRLGQVVSQFHDSIPAGFICGQFPEAGQPFQLSDPITLIVSRGPQTDASATPGTDATPDPNATPGSTPGATPDAGTNSDGTTPDATPADGTNPDGTANDGTGTDNSVPQVKRAATISVDVPAGGPAQEVTITVNDANGSRTVYKHMHDAGQVVSKTVHVTRPQGGSATVKVFVGGNLIRQLSL